MGLWEIGERNSGSICYPLEIFSSSLPYFPCENEFRLVLQQWSYLPSIISENEGDISKLNLISNRLKLSIFIKMSESMSYISGLLRSSKLVSPQSVRNGRFGWF